MTYSLKGKSALVSPALDGEPGHWQLRQKHRNQLAKFASGSSAPRIVADKDASGTRFAKAVVDPENEKNITKDGVYSIKTGPVVTKGVWRGMKIRTLTLEERQTCPRACENWRICYGNNMPWARRLKHGADFERLLVEELKRLSARAPIVVRMHMLGDFYSVGYVRLWQRIVETMDVRVFGYTAHPAGSRIGSMLAVTAAAMWDRFAIRFSGRSQPATVRRAITVRSVEEAAAAGAIVCPAQTGKSPSCGRCGLCWHSSRTIAFLEH